MKFRSNSPDSLTTDSVLAGIVFVSVVAGSSYTWFRLAQHTDWVTWLAWVPFVAIDVGGLYFGTNWINGKTVKVRVWGKVTTLLAVGISIVANGVEHALTGGFITVTLWLTVSVGAVPPAVMFAVAHQWALKRQAAAKARKPVEAKPVAAAVAPKPTPAPPVEIEPTRGQRDVIVEWVSRQDERPKAKEIQDKYGVSRATAFRVLSDVRAG